MSKSILDDVIAKTWDADRYGSIDQCVIDTVDTYADMGRLIGELLEAMGGIGDTDDRALEFAGRLVAEYIDQYNPQPGWLLS